MRHLSSHQFSFELKGILRHKCKKYLYTDIYNLTCIILEAPKINVNKAPLKFGFQFQSSKLFWRPQILFRCKYSLQNSLCRCEQGEGIIANASSKRLKRPSRELPSRELTQGKGTDFLQRCFDRGYVRSPEGNSLPSCSHFKNTFVYSKADPAFRLSLQGSC